MISLEYLDLKSNQITTLESSGLGYLKNLVKLWIGKNNISSLKNFSLESLTSLKFLDLQDLNLDVKDIYSLAYFKPVRVYRTVKNRAYYKSFFIIHKRVNFTEDCELMLYFLKLRIHYNFYDNEQEKINNCISSFKNLNFKP